MPEQFSPTRLLVRLLLPIFGAGFSSLGFLAKLPVPGEIFETRFLAPPPAA